MKKCNNIFIISLASALYPTNVFSVDSIENLDYSTDLSINILAQLFGKLVPLPDGVSAPANVFSDTLLFLMPIASMIALTMATVLVYFGTIKASNKGTLFAQGQTGLQTPLRTVAALGLLIPDKYGYPIIQKIFMWFIINGLVMANSIWGLVIERYQLTTILRDLPTTSQNGSPTDDESISLILKSLFYQSINLLLEKDSFGYSDVMFDVQEGIDDLVIRTVPDSGNNALVTRKPILFDFSNLDKNKREEQTNKFKILGPSFAELANQMLLSPFIQDIVQNLVEGTDTLNYPGSDVLIDKRSYEDFYNQFKKNLLLILTDFDDGLEGTNTNSPQQIKREGWIVAGSYYWRLQPNLIGSGENSKVFLFNTDGIVQDFGGIVGRFEIESSLAEIWQLLERTQLNFDVGKQVSSDDVSVGANPFSFPLKPIFEGSSSDTLFKFIIMCQQKIISLINFMIGVGAGSFIGMLIASVPMPGFINPVQNAIKYLIPVVIGMTMIIISLILSPLIIGSLYIPIYPMVIFFSATLGWLVKVIEAIVAAPIIAVALTEPTEDEYGRASQVAYTLLNITLRPALMIAGLVFAQAFLEIALQIVGKTILMFEYDGALAITFSFVLWDFLKATVCVTIIQIAVARSFSLIYILPDKVFSSIGLKADSSDTKGLMNDFKQGMDESVKYIEGFFKFGRSIQKVLKKG